MSSTKPHLSFTFEANEYRKRSKESLPPLSFSMGGNRKNRQPLFVRLGYLYLDYLMKRDYEDKFKMIDDRDENYAQVIKHPMDFYKIREKLNKNQYNDLNSFKKDVDLIGENCIQYNDRNSPIVQYSLKLQSDFNEIWNLHNSLFGNKIDDALRALELRDEAKSSIDSMQLDSFKFPDHPVIHQIVQEKPRRVKEKRVVQNIRKPIEVNERLNENLTADEKQKLAKKIDELIPALLGDVIDILKDSLNLDLTQENIIPFSDIDTPVLRRIEAVVKEAKGKEQSVKRMYQNFQMPSEEQIKILKNESKKFEDLLSKRFTVGSDTSSDNDTDTADSSDMDNTSSSGDSDS